MTEVLGVVIMRFWAVAGSFILQPSVLSFLLSLTHKPSLPSRSNTKAQ